MEGRRGTGIYIISDLSDNINILYVLYSEFNKLKTDMSIKNVKGRLKDVNPFKNKKKE